REYELAMERGEDQHLTRQAMAEVQPLRRSYPAALDLYDALLSATPDADKLWNERGVALLQMGRGGEAFESCTRAGELTPGYPPAQNNLGVTVAHEGKHEDAIERFREAIRNRPEFETPRLNLGLLLLKLRRFQLALQAYRQVLEFAEKSAAAWN